MCSVDVSGDNERHIVMQTTIGISEKPLSLWCHSRLCHYHWPHRRIGCGLQTDTGEPNPVLARWHRCLLEPAHAAMSYTKSCTNCRCLLFTASFLDHGVLPPAADRCSSLRTMRRF